MAAGAAKLNAKKKVSIQFGEESYWNDRYSKVEADGSDCYEWYLDVDVATSILQPYLETEGSLASRILIIGCGNSSLSYTIFNAGYKNIVNIDFSGVVISNMQKKYRKCEGMQYLVADVRNLGLFADESFDFIFDKGCLDAVFSRTDGVDTVHLVCEQLSRLLVDKGVFISISYGVPATRIPHYRKPLQFLWTCEPSSVLNKEKDSSYTCYICKKDVEKWRPTAQQDEENSTSASEVDDDNEDDAVAGDDDDDDDNEEED